MCFFDAREVRRQMNRAGAAWRPFLFAVDFELHEGLFVEHPLERDGIGFSVAGIGNKAAFLAAAGDPAVDHEAAVEPFPMEEAEYLRRFDTVRRGLLRGDSFLANLTVATRIETPGSLTEIFRRAEAPYQLCVPDRFVCFSPERFVRIAGGRISTNPMKGTISASVPDAERVILADPKETAEHYTIVDLLRNDLGMHADRVSVERFRYIDRIATLRGDILQVSSEIAGRLPEGYDSRLGDIVFDMLPAGSVSGAPKSSTLRIIRQAEGSPRGYYTGVFGYYDGRTLDSAVLIRFIERRDGELWFRSGGGITASSDPRAEYREVLEKIYLPFR